MAELSSENIIEKNTWTVEKLLELLDFAPLLIICWVPSCVIEKNLSRSSAMSAKLIESLRDDLFQYFLCILLQSATRKFRN